MSKVLSCDFGGNKLTAGLVDLDQGRLLKRSRQPTPPDAAASLSVMVSMMQDLLTPTPSVPPEGIGVSFGGLVEADSRTIRKSHHIPGWDNSPLAVNLENALGLNVMVVNDADAAALGEYHYGAGRGTSSMLYLTVSTGIGAGLIIYGDLYRGEHALAGEIGHMILQRDGPLCPCGRRGCLESLASGTSIAREMQTRLAKENTFHGDLLKITAQSTAEAARAGDPTARTVWEQSMQWLGIGIANAVNLLNPGCVVIGGGVSKAGDLLLESVGQTVSQYALNPQTSIKLAVLGDDANLLGAGTLFRGSLKNS